MTYQTIFICTHVVPLVFTSNYINYKAILKVTAVYNTERNACLESRDQYHDRIPQPSHLVSHTEHSIDARNLPPTLVTATKIEAEEVLRKDSLDRSLAQRSKFSVAIGYYSLLH